MIGVGRRSAAVAVRAEQEPAPLPGSWHGLDLERLDAEEERAYWIALSLVPGVGPVGFARMLRTFGSGRAAWEAGQRLLSCLPRTSPDAALGLRRLRQRGVAAVARRVLTDVAKAGGTVVTALDAEYPPALAATDPRPPVLYRAGDPAAFLGPAVAIVGTRRATGYGRAAAQEIADELARAGVTIVSGLALGIDGEAHAATLSAGGRGIAVLPSPLDRVYPPRHRELAARLARNGGAVLTELAPGTPHGKPDFARRNRIIAGLAGTVVVVEAPDRSGALLTAAAAVELGRDLFAVPGPIHSVASAGCNRLIADQQASIVTSAAGLLTSIGALAGERPMGVASLSESEARVLYALIRKPASVEELRSNIGFPTSTLASALTLLEARGLVVSYGGATFHPTLAARRIGQTT